MLRGVVNISIMSFWFVLSLAASGFAQDSTAQNISGLICTGYNTHRDTDPWRELHIDFATSASANCPQDQALFSVVSPGGMRRAAKRVHVFGTCCPIPKGILQDIHVYSLDDCPQSHIATGVKQEVEVPKDRSFESMSKQEQFDWDSQTALQYLRCTKIDVTRFSLSKPTTGVAVTSESSFRSRGDAKISRSQIPIALRYGLGRSGVGRWTERTCLGYPWGSVLIGKSSKYCPGFRFSSIMRKVEEGPAIPVKTYDSCVALRNPLSSKPECLKEAQFVADSKKE